MSSYTKSSILYVIKSHTKENPIKSREIKEKLGCSDVKIREAVHELRTVDNFPICSGSKGYFYALDISEARHTINHLRSRAREMFDAAEGMEKAFEKDNQLSIV